MLRPQARALLAILVMAYHWPERFKCGAVLIWDLPRLAPTFTDHPDSLRQSVHRARKQCESSLPGVRLIRRGQGESATLRLATTDPAHLHHWLVDAGYRLLPPKTWGEFLVFRAPRATAPGTVLETIEDLVARKLMADGRNEDAIAAIEIGLAAATEPRIMASLSLARALALIRRGGDGDWEGAHDTLLQLSEQSLPQMDLQDCLREARTWIELAYTRFLTRILRETDVDKIDREIATARGELERANTLQATLGPGERARLLTVSALLKKAEASTLDGEDRDDLLNEVELSFTTALGLFIAVEDVRNIGRLFYNLGELCYARHRLHLVPESEEPVVTALGWYRAAIALSERLETNREFVVEYARTADTLGLLIACRARSASPAELARLLEQAEQYLDVARGRGNPIELQLVEYIDGRIDRFCKQARLQRAGRGSSEPAKKRPGASGGPQRDEMRATDNGPHGRAQQRGGRRAE